MEVMKALTKSIVEDTVRQLREEIRHEIREEIRREFKSHFGDMTPSEHAVQHSRLDKFLNLTDHLTQNFWGQLIGGVVKWASRTRKSHYPDVRRVGCIAGTWR